MTTRCYAPPPPPQLRHSLTSVCILYINRGTFSTRKSSLQRSLFFTEVGPYYQKETYIRT